MSCLLLDYFFWFVFFLFIFLFSFLSFLSFFWLQYVNFPNANLLVFLFPGFIVIPKPSQLSQWNSSIASIFLLLKNPATQSLMLLFTLQALQVFLYFDTPPLVPSLPSSLPLISLMAFLFFSFITHSTYGRNEAREGVVQRWTVALTYCWPLEF